jgi:hypothetical protein
MCSTAEILVHSHVLHSHAHIGLPPRGTFAHACSSLCWELSLSQASNLSILSRAGVLAETWAAGAGATCMNSMRRAVQGPVARVWGALPAVTAWGSALFDVLLQLQLAQRRCGARVFVTRSRVRCVLSGRHVVAAAGMSVCGFRCYCITGALP